MDQNDIIAQFCAVTDSEVDTATQYLDAANYDLESAIGLFFASDGASAQGQTDAFEVRDRIEGTTDQLIDPEELQMEEQMRQLRRQRRQNRPTRSVFSQGRNEADLENLTPHERRLAKLFRPPFDLIEDIELDDAKELAQETHKWILINVQDAAEFQCQMLNRDLWSNQQIKEIVSQSFVFLQYDADTDDGETYRNLYPFESFPHIAILDPWTGEQVRVWNTVPKAELFLEQLIDYIGSLDQHTGAAVVEGDAASSTAASSAAASAGPSAPASAIASTSASTPVSATPEPGQALRASEPAAAISAIDNIEARDVPEPAANATRIQLRTGDGKRIVHKFALDAPVSDIYAYVKFAMPELQSFTLTADRKNLEGLLEETIEGANLKNSLVLIDSK